MRISLEAFTVWAGQVNVETEVSWVVWVCGPGWFGGDLCGH